MEAKLAGTEGNANFYKAKSASRAMGSNHCLWLSQPVFSFCPAIASVWPAAGWVTKAIEPMNINDLKWAQLILSLLPGSCPPGLHPHHFVCGPANCYQPAAGPPANPGSASSNQACVDLRGAVVERLHEVQPHAARLQE